MMDLIQNFFSRNNKAEVRKNFSLYFFSLPEHKWIADSGARTHFEELFKLLPAGLLDSLMTKYPVTFVQNHNWHGNQVGMSLTNTIVIFPEFQKLLQSPKRAAIAYIAHELAFILLEADGRKSDDMMAEVEADKFVSDLGLMFELEEFLMMLDETDEKRLRLTYLTIHHFAGSSDN